MTDTRDLKRVKYPNDVILQWALSVFFFRRGSKNAFQTAAESLKLHQRKAVLKYLGLDEDESFPHRTTVDDYLAIVHAEEINDLLTALFNWAKKNKIFYNHAESLLPNNQFHLACDGGMGALLNKQSNGLIGWPWVKTVTLTSCGLRRL